MTEGPIIGVKPLSAWIGAEITGIDLNRTLDDVTFQVVYQAWLKHQVLVLRNQQLTEERQIAFGQRFGELQTVRTTPGLHTNPYVLMVSNVVGPDGNKGALPDGEMQFHSDQCYYEVPAKATLLYSIEVPPRGGDTMFSNTTAVYESLPRDVKERLEGLKALNVYDYDSNSTVKAKESSPDAPKWVHPVVRTHDETGLKCLYVNRLMTDHIIGMDRKESDKLLEYLYQQAERPEFIYTHKWAVGDLVMWDNRCTLHARTDFSPNTRRMLRRISIKGRRPV
jgi:taurine dioxygenase